jgi:phosphohistidine phosphatase
MKLVLIRHAEAEPMSPTGPRTDFDRKLTPLGHAQSKTLAESLKRIGCVPGIILTSPLVRSLETASILADIITPDREPIECQWLALGERRPKRLTKTVTEFGAATTFLIGHMPDLAAYAGWLLGTHDEAIDFDKAAAALVKFPGAPGKASAELKWLVPPAWYQIHQQS